MSWCQEYIQDGESNDADEIVMEDNEDVCDDLGFSWKYMMLVGMSVTKNEQLGGASSQHISDAKFKSISENNVTCRRLAR